MNNTEDVKKSLFHYLLRLGDDALILGQRLSEWCGHGPILEEDIALANISLDCIGQATMFLRLAGEIEGQNRNEDALAYWRNPQEFRNSALVELPKGDFAFTIVRQLFFSCYEYLLYGQLKFSANDTLRGIAEKAVKEAEYHVRHSREWCLRLGDGTDESHRRIQNAVDDIWVFTQELFLAEKDEELLEQMKICPNRAALNSVWLEMITNVLNEATLTIPQDGKGLKRTQFREAKHTEHIGHLLSEMQIVARSHPGAVW